MPGLRHNPARDYPEISDSAYIDQDAVIIGKVKIGDNVLIGPGAVLRADEPGSEIIVKEGCNVQDGAVFHCLEKSSIIIEKNVSLAHGSVIHGPCQIGEGSFVGFNSVIFKVTLGKNVVVQHLCCVQDVCVADEKLVKSGSVISSQDDADGLCAANSENLQFSRNVVAVNKDLAQGYQQ